MEIHGGPIADAVVNGLEDLQNYQSTIRSKMESVKASSDDDKQMAMIELNFMIGQYNAMLDLYSAMLSNLTDSLKSIANKM